MSRSLTQLDPPIPLYVPEKEDEMLAWMVIDYHAEHDLFWIGPMRKTGEIWMLANHRVRATRNETLGRGLR